MRLRKVLYQIDKRIAWIAYRLVDFEDKDCDAYHYLAAEKSALEVAREIVKQEEDRRSIERMDYAD